jgi:hypothetical protein
MIGDKIVPIYHKLFLNAPFVVQVIVLLAIFSKSRCFKRHSNIKHVKNIVINYTV